MELSIPAGLSQLLARAFSSGAEVSLRELARLLDIQGDVLTAASQIVDFTNGLGLELAPNLNVGDFDSDRVIRLPTSDTDRNVKILAAIENGESLRTEFKSSLLCSVRHWAKDGTLTELESLPGEVLKTICAFLNTDGGDLLIGVDDDGRPCNGIDLDLSSRGWDLDRWQLHLSNLIESRFFEGSLVASYVRINTARLDNVPVVHIEVMARETRNFVQKEKGTSFEFFTRNGSRTSSLALPEFYSHLTARAEITIARY